ncbi:hypothetical protein [Streptomyces sp. GMY02]|uniref:hypothetical protein n=1 Tax=Streptomyces sp. GMY02 TaxID=1333528 RepID=UPI0020B704D8|nr:hypothetical protein [Streptomyces sp. GMY02]
MTSEHNLLWRRCTFIGRILLPLVDQELWRRPRRHENLRAWGIDTAEGERLIEVLTALAIHSAAVDATAVDALPLRTVADAATGKRDVELLAGLPDTFSESRDEQAVSLLRLYSYKGGQESRRLFQLTREVRHALLTLAQRSRETQPKCGELFHWAKDAGLLLESEKTPGLGSEHA